MEKSKVYFADFRVAPYSDGLIGKLKRLLKAAGMDQMDLDGKFVAIKTHFGELGNLAFLRPNYARTVAELVKEMGGKPFLTDCNTMYPGSRKNALEHLECAWLNGFTPYTVGCPVIIADGLKGTDDVTVPIRGGTELQEAKIGHAIMDADVIISLNHFKGHELAGFGGALKNLGMGCGSRAGKKDQHSSGKPFIRTENCRGCRLCMRECANGGLVFDSQAKKMTIDLDHCVGCGRCLGACNFDAIDFLQNNAARDLNLRMAEYAWAVIDGRQNFHISFVCDISPYCDCHGENDAPILPDVGMFASFDPVALDMACADACLANDPLPNSQLSDNMASEGFEDHHDHFINSQPNTEWRSCLEHAEELGAGTTAYELIKVK